MNFIYLYGNLVIQYLKGKGNKRKSYGIIKFEFDLKELFKLINVYKFIGKLLLLFS